MFHYKGKIENLTLAATQVNSMLFNKLFYVELNQLKDFTHSNTENQWVIKLINKHKLDHVYIKTYKPLWRFSKAIAYYTHKKPDTIFINYYKAISMDKFSLTGTIFHELIHLIDGLYSDYSFGHKTNNKYKYNNDMSAPYQIGYAAKKFSIKVFG